MKAPWINLRGMKEISSKQNKYTNWTYQTNSSCGENDEIATEKLDDTRYGEESSRELPIPSSDNVKEETNSLPDNEGIDELNPVEEPDLALLIQTDAEEEIDHLSDTEIEDEGNPVKDLDLTTDLDSNHGLLNQINDGEDVHALPHPDETDEMNSVEELDFTSQVDPNHKIFSQSESNGENKNDEAEILSTAKPFPEPMQGEVCSITQKSSFSTYVEINDFLHAPICGENVQNTFEFLDLNNKLSPQYETKLFHTITDYPEQPDCRLVRSEINKLVFLMKTDRDCKNNQKNNLSKSVVVPLHNSQSISNHSSSNEDFMHIRVPVVVGEYKIEICLEEYIIFEKGIMEVKDISSEVVLTNCIFVPNRFSTSLGNGTCTALKGQLFIEGYIHQNIEYIGTHTGDEVSAQNKEFIHSNQLCLNIVLDLIIHMLQVQKIQVSMANKSLEDN